MLIKYAFLLYFSFVAWTHFRNSGKMISEGGCLDENTVGQSEPQFELGEVHHAVDDESLE